MAEKISLLVNGGKITADAGVSLAAALMNAGFVRFGTSVMAEPRGPLCGMGICMACRVQVNGQRGIRSCQTPVREGMEVVLDA